MTSAEIRDFVREEVARQVNARMDDVDAALAAVTESNQAIALALEAIRRSNAALARAIQSIRRDAAQDRQAARHSDPDNE